MTGSEDTSVGQAVALVGKALVGAPAAVVMNTVKVIVRLVGALGAIPEAWIKGKAQGIQDRAEARSAIVRAVSKAAAKDASADSEIVRRGIEMWAGELLQRQESREAVAAMAMEEAGLLQQEGSIPPTGEANVGDVDDDWLNAFASYAEGATTERMQRLWARVAAGEARKPGSFSLASLRLVAELDRQTADEFTEAFAYAIGDAIRTDEAWNSGRLYSLSLRMNAAGLFLNAPGATHRKVTLSEAGIGIFTGRTYAMLLHGKPNVVKQVPVILLSKQAIELASLLEPGDEERQLREMAASIDKAGLTQIQIGKMGEGRHPMTVVWTSTPASVRRG